MTRRDYYQVLGVARGASPAEIRAAYARLVRLHHPDRAGELAARLTDVREAYRCLADPEARAAHDREAAAADRRHAERQQRVAARLRRYDRRHPHGAPISPWRRRGFALAVMAVAVAAGLSLRLLG